MKREATDLLIRKVDPKLKNELKKRARAHGRSLSDEAKAVLDEALSPRKPEKKMGTWLFNLVRPEDRGNDLIFEYHGEMPKPLDFE